MSFPCKTSVVAAVIGLCVSSHASAAYYSILADVDVAFSPLFDPLIPGIDYNATPGPAGNLVITGVAGIYQIDFYLQSGDYAPGQRGFGFLTFDLTLTGMLNNNSIPGWFQDTTHVDTNGPTPPDSNTPLWDQNLDDGQDTFDLLDIRIALAVIPNPDPADPRPTATTQATAQVSVPTFIGSLHVDYFGGNGTLNAAILTTGHARDSDGALIDDSIESDMLNAAVHFGFLPGDTDGDGDVDSDDLFNVKQHFGDPGPASPGDADDDGDTDIDDLVAVKNNFGQSPGMAIPGLAPASIPEPASLNLLALGGLLALRRR